MKISTVNKKKQNLDSSYIHNYDRTLERLHERIKSEMSHENKKLVQEYDVDAITQAIGKAARIKHLGVLLQEAKYFDNKPWKDITEQEIKVFIAEIMMKHSSKGEETWTTQT